MKKAISMTEIQNIQMMISKGIKRADIARICNLSQATIARVANGTHVMLQPKQPVVGVSREIPSSTKSDNIDKKLDTIIELLKDIKQMWS